MHYAEPSFRIHLLFLDLNETQSEAPKAFRSLLNMAPILITGVVAEKGYGHFSSCRPKFYDYVKRTEGVKLRPGTINIRVNGAMPIPSEKAVRVEGLDEIDLIDNQDILITPCRSNQYSGYWIFPVFKGTRTPNPQGHYPHQIIEVSFADELPNIKPGVELDLILLDSTN
jgi:hypothetical protein